MLLVGKICSVRRFAAVLVGVMGALVVARPAHADDPLPFDFPLLAWAQHMGGSEVGARAEGNAVAVDGLGNVYVTGSFNGTVTFGPGPGAATLSSQAVADVFILKMDRDGQVLWARGMDSTWNSRGNGIVVDAAGNVYVTGSFEGLKDLDPGPETMLTGSMGEGTDFFVVKLDSSGDFVWGHAFSSNAANEGRAIARAVNGDLLIAGIFRGTVDFDPGQGLHRVTARGESDSFLLRLDSDGNLVWVRTIGVAPGFPLSDSTELGQGYAGVRAIAPDADGNIFLTGGFRGTVDFNPAEGEENTSLLTHSIHYANAFVLKLDDAGEFVWARMMGGKRDEEPEVNTFSAGAEGRAIAVDLDGNAYITGMYGIYAGMFGEFDLNFAWFFSRFDFSFPNQAFFTCMVSGEGDFLWANATTTFTTWDSGFSGGQEPNAIAVAKDGTVYTAGRFYLAIYLEDPDFDSPIEPVAFFSVLEGVYLQHFAADGEVLWGGGIRSTSGSSTARGNALAVSTAGHLHLTGAFSGVMNFDVGIGESPRETEMVGNSRLTDLYVTKLRLGNEDEEDPVFADVNGDGLVDALDVQLVINAALGITNEHDSAADVNGDGVVDALDVQLVINAALGIGVD